MISEEQQISPLMTLINTDENLPRSHGDTERIEGFLLRLFTALGGFGGHVVASNGWEAKCAYEISNSPCLRVSVVGVLLRFAAPCHTGFATP